MKDSVEWRGEERKDSVEWRGEERKDSVISTYFRSNSIYFQFEER